MIVKMLFPPGGRGLMPEVGVSISVRELDPILVRRSVACRVVRVTFFKSKCHVVDHFDQGLECTHLAFDGILGVLSFDLAYDARRRRHLGEIGRFERLAEDDSWAEQRKDKRDSCETFDAFHFSTSQLLKIKRE